MIGYEERFEVLSRLCGKEALATVRESTAIVIGLGGVGSWAAEAMARSGVGHLRLVDMDTVAVSNTNRQSEALEGAYGRSKAEVLSERLRAINPEADIEVLVERVTAENVSRIVAPNAFVLECVDDVDAKAAIVIEARKKGDFVIVSGGAGGRSDPTRVRVADPPFEVALQLKEEPRVPCGVYEEVKTLWPLGCLLHGTNATRTNGRFWNVDACHSCDGNGSSGYRTKCHFFGKVKENEGHL